MVHCGQLSLLNISSFSLTLLIQVNHLWFLAQIVFFSVLEGFFFSPNILTTSLLWSPHPVSHFPHFVSLICWAPNSDHDAFLPECPHALDDCLKGLNPTWFQPVFPASFSRRFFPLCTLQPLKVLGISHGCHAFLCHQLLFFLFLFSPHLPFMTQFMLFFTCYPPLSPYTVSPFLFCVSIALLEYVTSFSL